MSKKVNPKIRAVPELVNQIHPTLNENIDKILDLSVGSHIKLIWSCPKKCDKGCEHNYEMEIRAKVKSKGCKYCTGESFCKHKSLLFTQPEIAKEWHPTKNGKLKPENFLETSHQKVWWICKKAECGCVHEYEQEIRGKVKSKDCLYCNNYYVDYHQSIAFLYPEKMEEWYYKENDKLGLDPTKLTPNSNFQAYWKCKKGCDYKDDIPCNENVKKEDCLHIFVSSIQNRIVNNTSCVYCIDTPQKICYHQSFEFLYPELVKEWDYERNGDIKPYEIPRCYDKKVYWKCNNDLKKCKYRTNCDDDACHHRWHSTVANRTSNNRKCPYCVGGTDKVCHHKSFDFLGSIHLSEWDYEKNNKIGLKPETTSYKSNKKAHWKCKNNHTFTCTLNEKMRGMYCPECKYTTQKKLMDFLNENLNYTIIQEKKFDFCKNLFTNYSYRFDFYIEELNLIIELDGQQHFEVINCWNNNVNIQRCTDIYKMLRINSRNISMIRLLTDDVYSNKNNWSTTLLNLITYYEENKNICENHFIDNNDIYDLHIRDYQKMDENDCLTQLYPYYKSYIKNKEINHPFINELIFDDEFNKKYGKEDDTKSTEEDDFLE